MEREACTTLSQISEDALRLALAKLRARFQGKSEAWLKRCARRLKDVEQVDVDSWMVKGRPELGDRYPSYLVRVVDGRYRCSCHSPYRPYAAKRRRSVCSHVGSVVLYRLVKRLGGLGDA